MIPLVEPLYFTMQRILFAMVMILAAAMAAPAPLSDHSALSDIVENMAYDVLQEASDG